ncbi:MAG: DUF3093 family protein [Acidobacteriaceae bacterium]|nr:DUF3093 family protein [Acidobacteriaceae bacterium]
MPAPITRYRPSRQFLWAALVALAIAVFSGWVALRWQLAWIAAGLALATVILFLIMAFSPGIEIFETHVRMGGRSIPWGHIRRLDRLMLVPLIVRLTTSDKKQSMLFYAGDADSANSLLRHLRRFSREALIDGVSYKQFWGESAASENKQLPPPRYPLLLADDEAEVERLFQRLKTVGHLDSGGSSSTPKSSPKGSEDK